MKTERKLRSYACMFCESGGTITEQVAACLFSDGTVMISGKPSNQADFHSAVKTLRTMMGDLSRKRKVRPTFRHVEIHMEEEEETTQKLHTIQLALVYPDEDRSVRIIISDDLWETASVAFLARMAA